MAAPRSPHRQPRPDERVHPIQLAWARCCWRHGCSGYRWRSL